LKPPGLNCIHAEWFVRGGSHTVVTVEQCKKGWKPAHWYC
jgi:hypothetical protein